MIDTLLGDHSPGEEPFEDLKATCQMIWGFEGPIADLMTVFANETAEDITIKGSELAVQSAKQKAALTTRAPCVYTQASSCGGLLQFYQ